MSKYNPDKYGTQTTETKAIKFYYVMFKLLSSDGFSTKEAKEELGISTNTAYRLVSSCKEALYIVFGDDIQVVFNRSVNKYKVVIHKPRFLLNNIPYINI